jgi:hypothetical protein
MRLCAAGGGRVQVALCHIRAQPGELPSWLRLASAITPAGAVDALGLLAALSGLVGALPRFGWQLGGFEESLDDGRCGNRVVLLTGLWTVQQAGVTRQDEDDNKADEYEVNAHL